MDRQRTFFTPTLADATQLLMQSFNLATSWWCYQQVMPIKSAVQ